MSVATVAGAAPSLAAPWWARRVLLDRPLAGPFVLALATLAVFHAVVAVANPAYWFAAPVWDEGYYVGIARHGYALPDGDYGRYTALPFSPGWPMLLRAVAWLLRLDPVQVRAPLAALLLVLAAQAFGWTMRAFSPDHLRNNLALLCLLLWPGSVYFCSGYAEALYLPLLLLSIGCMLRRRWLLAAWLAAACWFTRTPAVVVVGTLAAGIVVDACAARSRAALWRGAATLAAAMAIAALGLCGYMAMMRAATGDWFAFAKSYVAWQQVEVLTHRNLDFRTVYDALLLVPQRPTLLLAVGWALLVPVLVCLQRRAMPPLLTIFAAIAWSFFLLRDWQLLPYHDMLRWLAVVFPAHVALVAQLRELPPNWRAPIGALWLLGSGVAFVWCVELYARGRWLS